MVDAAGQLAIFLVKVELCQHEAVTDEVSELGDADGYDVRQLVAEPVRLEGKVE